MTPSWLLLRTRRILPASIIKRIPSVLIVLCICCLVTSFLLRRSRGELKVFPKVCNESMSNEWMEITVIGQIRTAKVKIYNITPKYKPKTILLWTKYFSEEYSNDFYFFQNGDQTFKKYNCQFSDCFVTTNKSLLSSADAVIFHGRDLRVEKIPKRLNDKQIWILYSMEPPKYMVLKWNLIQTLFNWTMTYRSDSDIQVKYGEIMHHDGFCKPSANSHKSVFYRNKGAIWLVSNCRTESRREAYVRELKKYFDVDVYGKCSRKRRCDPAQSEACYRLLDNYKYYLSFENSVCKDYITEKFYNVLKYDIIPVVMGGGNYSSVVPHNSYIDATKFPNPKKLSEYLTKVAKNSSWYDSFFEWKKYYSVHLHPWMCELCKRLHEPNSVMQRVPRHIWTWWVSGSHCRKWTKAKGFKNIFN